MSATDDALIAVSAVLPACGRMDLLDRSLDALMRQSLGPRSYEVIVVDDEPNHNTLHLVAGWRARTLERGPRPAYVANPGARGPAAARNRGWRAARAAIVAFTSDGAVPGADWLAQDLAAFRDDAVLLLALAALAAGASPLACAAAAAWLLLTARLCAQRLRGSARSPSQAADVIFTSMLLPPLAVFWRLAGAVRYRVRFA